MSQFAVSVHYVDAFCLDKPFSGNPAAVVVLSQPAPTSWMQAVAAQLNLSETSFVVLAQQPGHAHQLSWYTAQCPVPLCGHGTLAAGYVLLQQYFLGLQQIEFTTPAGTLTVRQNFEQYVVTMPAGQTTVVDPPADVVEALGKNTPQQAWMDKLTQNLILFYPEASHISSMQPDFNALLKASQLHKLPSIVVSALYNNADYQIITRCFAPLEGLNEDPATGSAHAIMANLWANKLGKSSFLAYQASARGGKMQVEPKPNNTVELSGCGRYIMRGKLYLSPNCQ